MEEDAPRLEGERATERSAEAASVGGAVTAIGGRIDRTRPGRDLRASPWGTILMLGGAAAAVWLLTGTRRASGADRRRPARRRGEGHEFTRTHYDAGAEHSLESGAARLPVTPAVGASEMPIGTHGETTR